MPLPRYERERERIGSARAGRAFLLIFAVAAVIGVIVGVIWIITGLMHLR
jgi:cell division septal protein FtsQ